MESRTYAAASKNSPRGAHPKDPPTRHVSDMATPGNSTTRRPRPKCCCLGSRNKPHAGAARLDIRQRRRRTTRNSHQVRRPTQASCWMRHAPGRARLDRASRKLFTRTACRSQTPGGSTATTVHAARSRRRRAIPDPSRQRGPNRLRYRRHGAPPISRPAVHARAPANRPRRATTSRFTSVGSRWLQRRRPCARRATALTHRQASGTISMGGGDREREQRPGHLRRHRDVAVLPR